MAQASPTYASTDPNFGLTPTGKGYVSTDPNFGLTSPLDQPDASGHVRVTVKGTDYTVPPDVAQQLEDMAAGKAGRSSPAVSGDWLERLSSFLPAIGGTVGGMAGAAGGSILGTPLVGGPGGAVIGAALGGAAGEAYHELIQLARGHRVPETPLEAAGQIAGQAALQGGAEGVGQLAAPALAAMGQHVMQTAVKPGLKILKKGLRAGESVPPVVQTLLDEGINVTPGGVQKLRDLIDASNQDIAAAIAPSTARIQNLSVASRLSETAKTFRAQVNPQADLEAISKVGENFLESRAAPSMIPAEAQALKVGTYRRIGEKYGQASAAGIEAEKALARGLKEEIAKEVPSVTALNTREGKLLEALDAVGRRVALSGNKDPIGFAWVAHNPTTFLAALFDRNPAFKSIVARGLYQSANPAAKLSPPLIRTALVSLLSGDPEAAMSTGPTAP